MKLVTNASCSPITVELCAAPKLRFRSDGPCDLGMEALRYAVCRFISRNPRLAGYYAAQSCALRFESARKDRKPKTFRCTAPAALLELPGAWAELRIRVDPDCITVTSLSLTDSYPKPAAEKATLPKILVWTSDQT